jgi:adenine/guanine phosphoribosyltransferase-like PRPP-binding protein
MKIPKKKVRFVGSTYMVAALVPHLRKIIIKESMEQLRTLKKELKFDSIVFTGMSGALMAPVLADRLNVGLTLFRKTEDRSHSNMRMEGVVPNRFLFVDDFICSGDTIRRTLTQLKEIYPDAVCVGKYLYDGCGDEEAIAKDDTEGSYHHRAGGPLRWRYGKIGIEQEERSESNRRKNL